MTIKNKMSKLEDIWFNRGYEQGKKDERIRLSLILDEFINKELMKDDKE